MPRPPRQTMHGRSGRRIVENGDVRDSLLGSLDHSVAEVIQIPLGLGRLDYQCLGRRDWKVHRRRVEAIVDQAFGDDSRLQHRLS